jgi:ribonuclease HIII
MALSDQFAKAWVLESALKRRGLAIELQQRTKAEEEVAVAAASILARDRFVEWIERASLASKIKLPLGASAAVVKAGQAVVSKFGEEKLAQVAKLHFKTTTKILTE